jgi:hypothetical protein
MLFIDNKYTRIYFSIIEKARCRSIQSYTEKHHIIPKSLGGDNSPENLINLTAREHFICHRLLVKMTSGDNKRKMSWAVRRMMTGSNKYHQRYKINSKKYDFLRKHNNKIIKGWHHSAETKERLSKVLKGRVFSKESIEKMSASRKGKKKPHHIADRLRTQNLGKPMSESSKKKLSNSLKGRKISDEAKYNMSLNHADFSGEKHPNAKIWRVEDPNSNIYILKGEITSFCKERGLPATTMRKMGRLNYSPKTGACKGWKVSLLNS